MATAKASKIRPRLIRSRPKSANSRPGSRSWSRKSWRRKRVIVDIVRGMSIPLAELPLLFEKLKGGGALGQSVPKSEDEEKEEN